MTHSMVHCVHITMDGAKIIVVLGQNHSNKIIALINSYILIQQMIANICLRFMRILSWMSSTIGKSFSAYLIRYRFKDHTTQT